MNKQLAQITMGLHRQRTQNQQIRRIVASLMDVLNIPDGDHLIGVFGDGYEADNREALETWVAYLLPGLDEDEVELRLKNLRNRAQIRIVTLAGSM